MAALRKTGRSASKEDDEDYWSASSASRFKSHVNLFDDSVDLDSAKRMLVKPSMFDEDDDGDVINWDGSSTTSIAETKVEIKSARYHPPGINYVPSNHRGGKGDNKVYRPTPSVAPLKDARTIEEVVKNRPPPTLSEITKMESEINELKRNLQDAQKSRFQRIPVQETIKRIIYGQPYSLELYKSKEDKIGLLDEAIRLHDGNAIIAVVLFLKQTISTSTFNQEMMQRKVATNHYISFLKQKKEKDWTTLTDFLGMLGRSEEAAMLKYKEAVAVHNPKDKVRNLQRVLATHFGTDPILSQDFSLVQEQISLLERQLPVEDADSKAEQLGQGLFKSLPRKASIVDQPVLTTLFYSCMYHYGEPENILSSPLAIKNAHRLTDKQFMWVALKARSMLKCWTDIEQLFKTKGWFGGTKMKAAIGFDKVLITLHKTGAPSDILNKYCLLIEDTDRRLELARKLKCNEALIETYKQQKDRVALEEFHRSLKQNTQEWYLSRDVLNTTTIKWKN